jgi:ferredoxin
VHESAVDPDDLAQLLTYERASEVVGSASAWAVSLCYCRHKAEHLGHACSAPLENCLTLDGGAQMMSRHGHARPIGRTEALEILDRSRQASLVFIGDNVQRRLTYLCSCCGCCCMQLRAITRHGVQGAVRTSSMMACVDGETCRGCGRCARRCPIQAIHLKAWPRYVERKSRMHAVVDEGLCLGCGVCQPACKKGALRMRHRGERVLTPEGTLERVLTMALERDRLQHLLFDDQEGLHLLFLNRLVGAVLRLPPVKQALLGDKLRSRFIGALVAQRRR